MDWNVELFLIIDLIENDEQRASILKSLHSSNRCTSNQLSTMKHVKTKLRQEIAEKLSKLSSSEKKKQSEIVANKLFELPVFRKSKRVSVYLSTENEINTEPIVAKLFQNNLHCFVPRYDKKLMEMVKLHSMEDWKNLPLTAWKIKQPKLGEKRENAFETGGLDLIIVPGVAFTEDGKRIGHGGGYYDRYLKEVKNNERTAAITVALAFSQQLVEDLPCDEHDQKIDHVLYMD